MSIAGRFIQLTVDDDTQIVSDYDAWTTSPETTCKAC